MKTAFLCFTSLIALSINAGEVNIGMKAVLQNIAISRIINDHPISNSNRVFRNGDWGIVLPNGTITVVAKVVTKKSTLYIVQYNPPTLEITSNYFLPDKSIFLMTREELLRIPHTHNYTLSDLERFAFERRKLLYQ